jgi:hypothetical protein
MGFERRFVGVVGVVSGALVATLARPAGASEPGEASFGRSLARPGALVLWVEPVGAPCPVGCPEASAAVVEVTEGVAGATGRRRLPAARDGLGRVAVVARPGEVTVKVRWPARGGPWRLASAFRPLDGGVCSVMDAPLRMRWRACDPGLDCVDAIGAGRAMRLPAVGPVAREAHLATPEDLETLGGWPSGLRDGVVGHAARTAGLPGVPQGAATEGWAPAGEGGSRWGEGATGRPVPAEDEAWYVTMRWADRPARGRRVLVLNPFTGAAVVASGGWETGPGPNRALGGASEEVHRAVGGGHRAPLVLGFLVDEAAPLGPLSGGCPAEDLDAIEGLMAQ